MNLRGTYAQTDYPWGDHVFSVAPFDTQRQPAPALTKHHPDTTLTFPQRSPLSLVAKILPVLYTPRRLLRTSTVLMALAFTATSALLLTVAGGAWAMFRWDGSPQSDPNQIVDVYRSLAAFATVLLVVPAFTLGQSVATLAARRQDEQLSTLSLLGAPRSTIVSVALAEPLVASAAGALMGVGGYFVLLVPMSLLHFRGAPLGYQNMVLPWWAIATTVAVLIGVSTVAALMGLRRVVVSPLGVRTKTVQSSFPWGRLLVCAVLAVCLAAGMVILQLGVARSLGILVFFGVIIGGFLLIDALGVVVVRLVARIRRGSSKVSVLVASRLVSASPKTYWRRVSGLALTSFIATFCGSGVALFQSMDSMHIPDSRLNHEITLLRHDLFTGILLTLGIAFLFIAVSAVINQAADLYDRASTFRELNGAGMSNQTIRRINVIAVMMPVVWVSALSAVVGLLLAAPAVGLSLVMAPVSFITIIGMVLVGALMVRGGLATTNPLISRLIARD